MRSVLTLLGYDFLAARYWFKTETLSKTLVALAFLAIFAAAAFVFYYFSQAFFLPLVSYKIFGILTSSYLIHAAIVVVSWFAFVSSSISIYGLFRSANRQINYLFTLPVKTNTIIIWLFLKSTILNVILLAMIFSPIVLAFNHVFFAGVTIDLILRFLFVLLLLSTLINSIANIVSYFVTFRIKENMYIVGIVVLFFLFAVMFILMKIIFPPSLEKLYSAPQGEFFALYNRLPLSTKWLPSGWLAETLVFGFGTPALLAVLFTLTIALFSLALQNRMFVPLFRFTNSQPFKRMVVKKISSWFFQRPLIYKDWLSIVRVPSEIGYSFFLFSIIGFFYFFVAIILFEFKLSQSPWTNEVFIFSSLWLLFFAEAFLLRLIFPLMAREGKNAWYLFTLPISKKTILMPKILVGIIGTVPLVIIACLLWIILPVRFVDKLFLVLFSVFLIEILAMTNTLAGAILPNFSQADDPEKVSTSGMGIITLALSLGLVGLTNYLFYGYLKQTSTIFSVFLVTVLASLFLLLILFKLARRSVEAYQF